MAKSHVMSLMRNLMMGNLALGRMPFLRSIFASLSQHIQPSSFTVASNLFLLTVDANLVKAGHILSLLLRF